MKKLILLVLVIFVVSLQAQSQTLFRSGRFFHHSTGENIWGPNGSSTSVPQQMTIYNTNHSYTGQYAVTMSEMWFPVSYDNEWYTWHTIFETNSPENISSYFSGNKIIMVKSCFPSSELEGVGAPGDTLYPDYKTIYNYKWHWRHILTIMKNHPQNFFVIWTNAPLTPSQTTSSAAMWSKQFCKWAKDTLANGLDPVFGAFPNNVYVFDFFSKLTDSNGYMLLMYAMAPDDPHPNATATALVAPQLVNEVFDHSIAYELIYSIKKLNEIVPEDYHLYQNYPNPFNPLTNIKFDLPKNGNVKLSIFDILGKKVVTLVNEKLNAGTYEVDWEAGLGSSLTLSSGIYLYTLETDGYVNVKKMVLMK
ncbi:T9SS type A sorting domain-containing protein [Bacteroidota bacterium]